MILRPIVLTPAAECEIADAATAYDATRLGLGRRFLDDLERVRVRIEEFPESCPEVHLSTGARRALMHWFPFGVLYRVQADTIQIIAVLPTRADPVMLTVRANTRAT